ncbi:hypothetical protein M407DRAFT_10750 [Tulasnella calospora MUT 4182]|uniref:Uncharacterized protein n=1 Tax=Tulasnella calospora MUT 4182 TaxID=1051891 RepID=A0A0C3PZ51_9AGAM|nr:hypothetical protein M407DRAFT_10750 [Tulasnella calospora MUT 4182]
MAHSDASLRSITPPRNRVGDPRRGTAFDGLEEDLPEAENSRSALRKIIRNIQSELAEKDQLIEEQRDIIQQLQSDVQGLKKTATKRRKRATAVPVNESEQLLETAAKKFTVMNHFYVADTKAFLKTPLSETWTEKSRFDSQENELEGSVRELDELLLDDLKERRIQYADRWAAVFEQAQQDERHSMTHRIRTSNTTTVFGSEIATELEAGHRPRSVLLQRMLGFNAENGSYERMPPILRANPDEPASKTNMLSSQVVKKSEQVIQAMLMGPASLVKDQDPDVSLSAKCNGKIWNVTSVTPGIIAFAAILIRYALSPDNEFGPTGQTSGIPYLADFEYYKMCLIVGQRKKLKEVMDLFDNLNGALFPNHKASWRDQRDSRHSLVEEDDDLFREIAEAASEEEGEQNRSMEPTVQVSIPAVRGGSSPPTTRGHSVIPTDNNNDTDMGNLNRNGEGETETQEARGSDTAQGDDRRMRRKVAGKNGGTKKRAGRKK